MTEPTPNVAAVRDWVEANQPQGIEKLSVASGVSSNVIRKLLNHGKAPKRGAARMTIARAIGAKEEDLFPPFVKTG